MKDCIKLVFIFKQEIKDMLRKRYWSLYALVLLSFLPKFIHAIAPNGIIH